MRRAGVFLLAALALAAPARGGETADAVRALLDRVEPRPGVEDGAAVVVPLVLKGAEPARPRIRAAFTDLPWRPEGEAERTGLVALAGESPDATDRRLLPSGVLLKGGRRERLLLRPLLVPPGEEAVARGIFCDARAHPRPLDEKTANRVVGPIAPVEQRKIGFLFEEEKPLGDLLRLQVLVAGVDPKTVTLEKLLAEIVKKDARAGGETLRGLPAAYGAAVCGHVAFVGHRPVEVVLLAHPRLYGDVGSGYLRALAFSTWLWERFYDYDPKLAEKAPMADYVEAARAIVGALGRSSLSTIRPKRKERGGGKLLRLRPPSGEAFPFAGRILIREGERSTEKDEAVWLEVFEVGGNLVFPPPLTKPGGRAVDEPPNVKGGAMTQEFLDRLAERRRALREALGY